MKAPKVCEWECCTWIWSYKLYSPLTCGLWICRFLVVGYRDWRQSSDTQISLISVWIPFLLFERMMDSFCLLPLSLINVLFEW